MDYFNGIFATTMLADATLSSALFLVLIDSYINLCVAATPAMLRCHYTSCFLLTHDDPHSCKTVHIVCNKTLWTILYETSGKVVRKLRGSPPASPPSSPPTSPGASPHAESQAAVTPTHPPNPPSPPTMTAEPMWQRTRITSDATERGPYVHRESVSAFGYDEDSDTEAAPGASGSADVDAQVGVSAAVDALRTQHSSSSALAGTNVDSTVLEMGTKRLEYGSSASPCTVMAPAMKLKVGIPKHLACSMRSMVSMTPTGLVASTEAFATKVAPRSVTGSAATVQPRTAAAGAAAAAPRSGDERNVDGSAPSVGEADDRVTSVGEAKDRLPPAEAHTMEPPTRAVPSALPPGMTREMRATSSATVVPIDAPAPARTPQPDPEMCPATTTVRRKLLRRAEKLILAEFAELFVPIQYMVFMVFAWYGYNRHAFNLGDSMANDHEFGVAILWVVALIMLDLLSTLLTIWAVQRSHVRHHAARVACCATPPTPPHLCPCDCRNCPWCAFWLLR